MKITPLTTNFSTLFMKKIMVTGSIIMGLFGAHFGHSQTIAGKDYSPRSNVDKTFDMVGANAFGQHFPAESFTFDDEVTGKKVIALTTSRHQNSKIYQTHPQWTPDGKHIVFRSDRSGKGLAYAISMDNHEITQIASGDDGSGFHLGWKENFAYHFRNDSLIRLDLKTLLEDSGTGRVANKSSYENVICVLDANMHPNGMALDYDEESLYFSTRVMDGESSIYQVDLASGNISEMLTVPFRIGHLQANPYKAGEMMYCWETGGDAPQRIWMASIDRNGQVTNRPLYDESDETWVTHEVFLDKDHIGFNIMGHLDRLQKGDNGIYSLNIRTDKLTFHGQQDWGGYWHTAGTTDLKWIVGDTFNGDIYRIEYGNPSNTTLLTTGHRLTSKSPFSSEAHSHHSISPDGKWLLFNSSLLTESDIMIMPLIED
ncbi:biopolymer transporter Tol [Echinicola soli]|uniref:Biopolymer transporter Tol n=1 Tax=Echinicola soli TaxID=2591634 RepID=A0A514CJ18_9BACT|nr:PD40 domain-containing protein [Echinicola soli]QDH79818.1 biopolymer transporter Tol [Echinicola soli]